MAILYDNKFDILNTISCMREISHRDLYAAFLRTPEFDAKGFEHALETLKEEGYIYAQLEDGAKKENEQGCVYRLTQKGADFLLQEMRSRIHEKKTNAFNKWTMAIAIIGAATGIIALFIK